MKRAYLICLLQSLTATLLFSQSNPVPLVNPSERLVPAISAPQADPKAQARVLDQYGKLPLSFEANQGQADARVKFLSRTGGYSLFLTADEAVLTLRGKKTKQSSPQGLAADRLAADRLRPVSGYRFSDTASSAKLDAPLGAGQRPSTSSADPEVVATGGVLRMKLRNANPAAKVTGEDELAGTSNYFIGNDPAKWRTKVPTYAKVKYEGIYPGIDLVYYGHQRELEYDFVLQPGASPQSIRLGIVGANQLRLEHGDLVLTGAGGDVHLRSPHIYQEANGVRQEVRGGYVMKSKSEVGFEVAAYDRRRALVIDPVLAYSTYLGDGVDGGGLGVSGPGIAVDSAGNAYVTGTTYSTDFPTVNPLQPTNHGELDAFVTKINADGTALVYSTYLGGSGGDHGTGIAVDSAGNAYVTGSTDSTDFPTANAFQATPPLSGFRDAFVTKINANGTALVYSTYLGGSSDNGGVDIAVDSTGHAYLTGFTSSPDFPTKNAIQAAYGGGEVDAFVTKINALGSALVYSTYLGGSLREWSSGIAVDSGGRAYVTGFTESTDFPTKNALQPTNHGGPGINGEGAGDAFVAKINAAGSALVYSTYLGGNDDDQGFGIAVDSTGNAYVTGETFSTDFPTMNAIQPTCARCPLVSEAFVTKISATGSALLYSTYLGNGGGMGLGIAVDASGNAYVTGSGFVSNINAGGTAFIYFTYLGGWFNRVAVDPTDSAYLVGVGNVAATPLAFQLQPRGAVIAKIASHTFVHVSTRILTFATQVIGTTSAPKKITFKNQGSSTLTINKVYVGGLNPGDFSQTNGCGATLAPGAVCTAYVTFTPTAKSLYGTQRQAGLGFSTPDPASPDAVALSGKGTVVSLSTSTLSFGDQAIGTTSPPQSVTLTNTGNTQLNFSSSRITGNRSAFSETTNYCETSIAPKASCTITVTFSPTEPTGIDKARITIIDDGGGSPQYVNLNGTGT
jgi:Beta-propeller repeat/Abnormal spindle-like microcephaly-assoc'd, ASPM-SPD-2-Hydin